MIEDSENLYGSLQEIRRRKLKLKSDIKAQEKTIHKLWDNIFHKKEQNAFMTPSKRVSKLITTGAGVFDGVMLGLKLYNRFKGK